MTTATRSVTLADLLERADALVPSSFAPKTGRGKPVPGGYEVQGAAGLNGTASNDIRVTGAFVPEAFTLDTGLCDGRLTPGSAINPSRLYRLPLWPIFPFNISTPILGVARGALQAFIEYTAARRSHSRARLPRARHATRATR